MESEETKGLAGPPIASPVIEAAPTFPEEIEGLSVPLPTSPVIEPISTSVEETTRLSIPLPTSPVIEPISTSVEETTRLSIPLPTSPIIETISTSVEKTTLSQPNQLSLEEPSQQAEKPDAQLVKATSHQEFPNPVMKEALKALIDNTISVVEYGNQVLYRCGYAEVLIVCDETFRSTPSNRISS